MIVMQLEQKSTEMKTNDRSSSYETTGVHLSSLLQKLKVSIISN